MFSYDIIMIAPKIEIPYLPAIIKYICFKYSLIKLQFCKRNDRSFLTWENSASVSQ